MISESVRARRGAAIADFERSNSPSVDRIGGKDATGFAAEWWLLPEPAMLGISPPPYNLISTIVFS